MTACVLSVCDGEPVGGWGEAALLPTLPSFLHSWGSGIFQHSCNPSVNVLLWSASQGMQVIITCESHCCSPGKVRALFKLIEWKIMTSLSPVYSHRLQLKQLAWMILVSLESQLHCLWRRRCLRRDLAVVVKSRAGEDSPLFVEGRLCKHAEKLDLWYLMHRSVLWHLSKQCFWSLPVPETDAFVPTFLRLLQVVWKHLNPSSATTLEGRLMCLIGAPRLSSPLKQHL